MRETEMEGLLLCRA